MYLLRLVNKPLFNASRKIQQLAPHAGNTEATDARVQQPPIVAGLMQRISEGINLPRWCGA